MIAIREELWRIAVAVIPKPTDLNTVSVLLEISFSKIPPEKSLNPSSIKCIPIMKIPTPATIYFESSFTYNRYPSNTNNM